MGHRKKNHPATIDMQSTSRQYARNDFDTGFDMTSPVNAKPNKNISKNSNSETQIIGLRLDKDLACSVKIEAAERNMLLKDLFAEMWALYNSSKKS